MLLPQVRAERFTKSSKYYHYSEISPRALGGVLASTRDSKHAALIETLALQKVWEQSPAKTRFKFQKVLEGRLLLRLYPDDISATIVRRISKHFPSISRFATPEALKSLQVFLCDLPTCVSQQVLRTLVNAWLTTSRMHDSFCNRCVFGCPSPDALEHYVLCPVLWRVIGRVFGSSPSDSLEVVLLLASPNLVSAFRLYAAVTIFHACRASHLARLRTFTENNEGEALEKFLIEIARGVRSKVSSLKGAPFDMS